MKKIIHSLKNLFFIFCTAFLLASLSSCSQGEKQKEEKNYQTIKENQASLAELLQRENLDNVSRYAIINQMANNLISINDTDSLILFLTDWVEKNPDDMYNAYWLFMTAYAYMSEKAEPVAEYYFDRILQNYSDLLVNGNSIHFMCLQNLIQISKTSRNRIKYFNELINRFPANVSITELYLRLALEYEKESEWDEALKSYSIFLAQPDASTIQISGEPNAYKKARQFVGFSNSSKDWTFESLASLEKAVKRAISNYDWYSLDKYKAKVNFFSMSWKQDEMDPNAQEEFSMRNFMRGQRVRYAKELDSDSNSNEAYLRTWGWSTYVPVWYFYFRKVNFPLDPDINGNWEWAGIYMGEKL
ncbi:MAG: tetratricopeptide repeat protein [Treponema sp.]|nr:tetratricopeptide repeat protein [Treponema sp.]